MAIAVLERAVGPLWLKRTALLVLLFALGAVLRCSVPLKRLVAAAVRQRRERERDSDRERELE